MQGHYIDFPFQARYYKLGAITSRTKSVWFVCHGYGQLAQYFLKNFHVLHDDTHCIIAPEGLFRFYTQGLSGRVGATWMTKEDRLVDISNYIKYLNSVYQAEMAGHKTPMHITLLGFSQGAATICRWALNKTVEFDRLILWAGLFPPDLDMQAGSKKLGDKEIMMIYGDQDQFLTEERLLSQQNFIRQLSIQPKTIVFKGGHQIDSDTLSRLA